MVAVSDIWLSPFEVRLREKKTKTTCLKVLKSSSGNCVLVQKGLGQSQEIVIQLDHCGISPVVYLLKMEAVTCFSEAVLS